MKSFRCYGNSFARVLCIGACATLASISAYAGGSMGLDEVIQAVAKAPKLVAEIQQELTKNGLKR